MSDNGRTVATISAMTTLHAASAGGASACAGAVIECIVGAAMPMINNLFAGGTIQERLLFSLVLAGTCTTLTKEDNDNFGCRIEVKPETLTEAFNTFTRLTGVDIRPHLPKPMVDFAAKRSLN